MKTLNDFVLEYRTKKSVVNDPEPDKVVGKDAEKNGTQGAWAIDEPTDDSVLKPLDKASITANEKRILKRMKAKQAFFVQGEAGWGKTSIIEDIAKRCKRSIVTVYLDKAVATDLGGIPVPVEGKDKSVKQELAMPGWAAYMWENPDKQFLLFFDEMNQAAPDVMNALMPIILKNEICGKSFKNYIVGAAGNFEHENDAVNELSEPLLSRFGGIITWKTGGEAEWKSAFNWMKNKWEGKISEDFIKLFESATHLFKNPREINDHVLKPTYELVQEGDTDLLDAETFYEDLTSLVRRELSRSEENELKELAEKMEKYIAKKGINDENAGRSSKGKDMVPEAVKQNVLGGMKNGFVSQREDGKLVKYGISKENIWDVVDPEDCNAEMLQRLINKYEADGIKWKYETNEGWKKDGLKDPMED